MNINGTFFLATLNPESKRVGKLKKFKIVRIFSLNLVLT